MILSSVVLQVERRCFVHSTSRTLSTTTTLPIIDFSAFATTTNTIGKDRERQQQQQVAAQVNEACRTIGCFYATGLGVPSSLQQDVLFTAKSFFNQPSPLKEQISMSKQPYTYRGYQKLGENVTNNKPDWHQAIDFLRSYRMNHKLVAHWDEHKHTFFHNNMNHDDDADDDDEFKWKQFVHGQNLFPSNGGDDCERLLASYVESCTAAGYRILSAMSLALGLEDTNYIQRQYFDDPFWIVRFIHYPGTAEEEHKQEQRLPDNDDDDDGVFGVATHTDYGFLTLVCADDTPGALQVMVNDGQTFVNADPLPDAFVVNIGDMMAAFTNGQWVATPHRVLPTKTTRISVPFFLEPNLDATVRPLLQGRQGDDGHEDDDSGDGGVVYGTHLYSKVSTNFVFRKAESK